MCFTRCNVLHFRNFVNIYWAPQELQGWMQNMSILGNLYYPKPQTRVPH